ncbi:MAG TPA: hypothetical protein VK421_04570 [Pyrinomonadaceae bacterium]|nr:hypothetical protein [Pyrinomonadaceae bacterium]
MKVFGLALALSFAALVHTGAAFDAAAQGRKIARPPADAAPPAPTPAPDKKNARPAGPENKGESAGSAQTTEKKNARAAGEGGVQQPANGSSSPRGEAADGARYSFEFAQPAFIVSRYVIEHDTAGRAKISFQKKTDGLNDAPVVEQFDIAPAAFARILSAWEALKFLDSQADYQADKQFPHLGTMRLRMRSGGRAREAEFNWTNDEHAAALAREYKALAEQQLFVFDMALARQYQPSEAIKVLKRLETLLKMGGISDPPQLLPFLRDLTTDERIPLIARNHAERLIKQIAK